MMTAQTLPLTLTTYDGTPETVPPEELAENYVLLWRQGEAPTVDKIWYSPNNYFVWQRRNEPPKVGDVWGYLPFYMREDQR